MLIVEHNINVKYRTSKTKTLFLYVNLCLSVMLNNLMFIYSMQFDIGVRIVILSTSEQHIHIYVRLHLQAFLKVL